VLFTDMVDSTALLARAGAGVADDVRRHHFGLLRDAIGVFGGQEVKNLGDGIMATFDSAAAAVSCAVAMHQAVDRHNRRASEPAGLRVGIALGDADHDDGDWFGLPVVEAARLCNEAGSGEILTTDLVRAVARGRVAETFRVLGQRTLKGLDDAVVVVRVEWERPEGAGAAHLPVLLERAARDVFAGRTAERDLLVRWWKEVTEGDRRLVLVSGEPGIGKTRLVAELASELVPTGATVLYGRCDPELGMPYSPWVDALAGYVESAPADVLARHVGRHGGELARLVPELARRVPDIAPPRTGDAETERWWLLDAIVGLVSDAAADAPVLLFLDDLQWADRPSLQVLERLVEAPNRLAVLVVGAYRDSEVVGSALESCLARLRPVPGVEPLPLDGLSLEEVGALTAAAAGCELGCEPDLVRDLWTETDGNPFFVTELLRHLQETGALDAGGVAHDSITLPASIRDVIGERVRRLGPDAQAVLAAAAVLGRPYQGDLLAAAAGVDMDTVVDVLDAAMVAALVTESDSEPGTFDFTHCLIGHSLYDALLLPRRRLLHERVALALESEGAPDDGDAAAELAHHWQEAANGAALGRAADYAALAGDAAADRLAPDQAVCWYMRALDLADRSGALSGTARTELLIRLGAAQRDAGDAGHRRTLLDAAALAMSTGDGARLARAALENSRGFFSFLGQTDSGRVRVLEAAIESAPDDGTRARLLALLASELLFGAPLARRRELADRALELARGVGDPATLAFVLTRRFFAIFDPSTLEERRAELDEAMLLTERAGDLMARFVARTLQGHAAVEAGDRRTWDEALAEAGVLAGQLRQPTVLWVHKWWQSTSALVDGDLERAEHLALEAYEAGERAGQADAGLFCGAQVSAVRLHQGRVEEYEAMTIAAVAQYPGFPWLRAGLTEAAVELGRPEEAAVDLLREVNTGFTSVPDDPGRVLTLCIYAEVAARLEDKAACLMLTRLLAPASGQMAGESIVVFGAVDRLLGEMALVLGRDEEGESLLRAAMQIEDRMGAVCAASRTRQALVQFLHARGRPGDAEEAERLVAAVADVAHRYDIHEVQRRLEELEKELQP